MGREFGMRRIVAETRENATVVRDLFEAFQSHNLDRASAMVTEDFELTDFAAEGQTFRGPEGPANGSRPS